MSAQINCEEGEFQGGQGSVYFLKYSSPDGNGTPLIMIHGGPGFTHHYLEPLYSLASERPVIFYDQLGCGKSDRPSVDEFCNVNYFVNELRQLIDHLSFSEVCLLGHSWGSAIAASYAAKYSNVSHLIFASPFMSARLWNDDIQRYKKALPSRLRRAVEDFDDPDFQEAFNLYYARHVYGKAAYDRSIVLSTDTASPEVYRTMWGQNEFSITGVLKDFECSDELSLITAKTLFTAGEKDTGSPKACRILSKQIPQSKVVTLRDCAHFPHLEKKEEYVKLLRSFLSDNKVGESQNIFARCLSFLKNS